MHEYELTIQGVGIDDMLVIKDTTSGFITIALMVIMLLLIYIIYQTSILWINSKKIDRLQVIKQQCLEERNSYNITQNIMKNDAKWTDKIKNNTLNSKKIQEDLRKMQEIKMMEQEEAEDILDTLYR